MEAALRQRLGACPAVEAQMAEAALTGRSELPLRLQRWAVGAGGTGGGACSAGAGGSGAGRVRGRVPWVA